MAVLSNVKVKWASVQAPNEKFTPQWCIDGVLDEATARELHAQGLNVKKDKEGDLILKFKRNVYRKDGNRNQAPRIVGPDKQPFLDLIGNGSVCNIQYSTYDWDYAGKSGKGTDLIAVQVVEHVPFEGQEDEFDAISESSGVDSNNSASSSSSGSAPVEDFDDDLPF